MARELPESTKDKQMTHQEISQRAYEIFMERGCPEGRDLEHWLEAEAQLRARTASPSIPTATTTKPTKGNSRQGAGRRA